MAKLVCTVELDKTTGITVKVENADADIIQIMHMDGTQILTTVQKGTAETDKSSITQKFDSIAIKCKTYTVEAETITQKSTKATLHESADTFDIKATKDLTEHSDAKVVLNATGDVTVDGANVKIKGETDVTLNGLNVKGTATAAAELKGANTKLEGSAKCDVKGGMASVKGDSMLDLGASLTKISGVMSIAGGGPPMMIG
ncbi:MAG: hypothetical protein ACAI25_04620 [Planctomycetota bacterium]